MQFDIPTLYVPYGPIGHPQVRAYVEQAALNREEVEQNFRNYLERRRGQGDIPGCFYDERRPLETQGYYLLPVKNGEVPDTLMEFLPPADIFVPRQEGQPGRTLADVTHLLPSYVDLAVLEVWSDHPDCDHDMGLESWQCIFRTDTGHLLSAEEGYLWKGKGTYFHIVTCPRCGTQHAYPEQEDI